MFPPLWFHKGSNSAHTSLHTVKLKYAAEEGTVFFPEGSFECLENVMTVKQPFEITKPKLSDKELWLFMLQVQTWSLPQQLLYRTDTQRPTHSTLPLHPELLSSPQKQELRHHLPFSPPDIITLKPLASSVLTLLVLHHPYDSGEPRSFPMTLWNTKDWLSAVQNRKNKHMPEHLVFTPGRPGPLWCLRQAYSRLCSQAFILSHGNVTLLY